MSLKELYEHDFARWTASNAQLLRAGRLEEADIEHIAEELEDMGRREQHELEGRLRVLLTHLLKMALPEGAPLPELAGHDSRAGSGNSTPV